MRILSVDPGSTNVGVSVLENEELLYCTRLNLFPAAKNSELKFNERLNIGLNRLYLEFLRIGNQFSVDHIGWEIVPGIGGFGHKDYVVSTSALLKSIAFQYELPFQGIAAITAKKMATGNHKASKEDVREKVYSLYPDFKTAFPDVKYNQWDAFDSVIIGRSLFQKRDWEHPVSSNLTGRKFSE